MVDHTTVDADLIPVSILTRITNMKIYFKHASVGQNICDGIDALAVSNSARYTINRTSVPTALWYQESNGFGDTNRGNPGAYPKISIFYNNMTNRDLATNLAVSMFKFCFIDAPSSSTDATNLFNSNRTVIEGLEGLYTNTVFVWWTMPIQTASDLYRQQYNEQVRSYCISGNKFLIDIADIECYSPSGQIQTDSSGLELMYSNYTTDGGHLNGTGSLLLAQAWWVMMAKICRWK
jgi:hypothetical protein